MRGVGLLEGERVHRVVRPHPLGRLGDYAAAGALLLLAGFLAVTLGSEGGRSFGAGLDGGAGAFAVPMLLVVWWVLLGLTLGPLALFRRAAWPLGLGVAVAVLGGLLVVFLGLPDPSAAEAAAMTPWLTLAAVPGALVLAEALRRSPTWLLTNLRLVRRTGVLAHKEEGWRLHRFDRVEMERRGPAALDFGDLVVVPVEKDGKRARLRGVRPLRGLRDELEMLLHTPAEAPYLGGQRDAADRVARLLRPGDAPPR